MRDSNPQKVQLGGEESPTLDWVFELLSSRRRRYALYYLCQCENGVATVEEVVDHLLVLEGGAAEAADLKLKRQSITTSLKHVHLLKMVDANVLEYDEQSGMIRYWGQPTLDEWLEHAYHKEQ